MSDSTVAIGALLAIVGGGLIGLELIHPGVFLLVPGSTLLAGGFIYLISPGFLTGTPYGPFLVALVAIAATIATIPLYQHWGKTHLPMTTMPDSLAGKYGTVIAPIVPNTLKGKVRVGSEIWSARAEKPIPAGVQVRVLGGSGVALLVQVEADAVAAG
jgi:membrane protein implicated in regulation of membrane protease activity